VEPSTAAQRAHRRNCHHSEKGDGDDRKGDL
jgi:hypothetical protein